MNTDVPILASAAPTEHAARNSLLASACRKNAVRLAGLLAVAYVINHLDRNSISYAGITMNETLGLSASQFGWAAGITILSYSLLEVPSNLIMQRVGARLWLSRIMITWGLAASATALAVGPNSLYLLRLLLGAAEAGFFPGVILYLSQWFPAHYRARVLAVFLLAIPLSSLIGGPLAAVLLGMDGIAGLHGWQWMFIVEGAPAVILGVFTYLLLADHPRDASWLTVDERAVLVETLASEQRDRPQHDLRAAMRDPRVAVLTAVQFGFTLGTYGIVMWLPLILKEHGLSTWQIGLISVPAYLVASVAMMIWARHVDRRDERVGNLTVSCALAAVGLLASVLMTDLVPTLVALTIALVGVSAARMIFWTIPSRFLVGTAAAGGVALINSIGILGGFFGPLLMGTLRDQTGSFSAGLFVMAAILILTSFAAGSLRLFLRER